MDHPVPFEDTRLSAACEAVRERLDALVDGELAEPGTHADAAIGPVQVHAHLAECPPCHRLAQQLRAQKQRLHLLATRSAADPGERASEALRERIERLRHDQRRAG